MSYVQFNKCLCRVSLLFLPSCLVIKSKFNPFVCHLSLIDLWLKNGGTAMSILGSRPRTILTTSKCNFKVPHWLFSSIVYSDSILPGKINSIIVCGSNLSTGIYYVWHILPYLLPTHTEIRVNIYHPILHGQKPVNHASTFAENQIIFPQMTVITGLL